MSRGTTSGYGTRMKLTEIQNPRQTEYFSVLRHGSNFIAGDYCYIKHSLNRPYAIRIPSGEYVDFDDLFPVTPVEITEIIYWKK